MNPTQYLPLDVYDEEEVKDTLEFAPTLGWSLFSLQDVYSRSDAYHVPVYGDKNDVAPAKRSWSGNFGDAVNDKSFDSLDFSGQGTETHITHYTKIVLSRPIDKEANAKVAGIESVWMLMSNLLNKIGSRADKIDGFRAERSSIKAKGGGSFVWGLVLLVLGGIVSVGGFIIKNLGKTGASSSSAASSISVTPSSVAALIERAEETSSSAASSSSVASSSSAASSSAGVMDKILSTIAPFADYVFYVGIGVAALGLLLLIIGIIRMNKDSGYFRQCRHGIDECIKDYREVKAAKRGFEITVKNGSSAAINMRWLYALCLKYGVSFPQNFLKKAK